jgi:soluble lytic murein transglycosylase-like protein
MRLRRGPPVRQFLQSRAYDISQVMAIARKSPGAFADAVETGLKLRKDQREQQEMDQLNQIASGGSQPQQPQGDGMEWGQPQLQPQGQYDSLIEKYSKMHGVDPRLARSVMQAESEGGHEKVSPKGAYGLFQIMPGTA